MATPHLLVYITAHGFGHVAQTAPVLNWLYQQLPTLKITICSNVNPALLASRVHAPYTLLPGNGDIGMIMDSALDVAVEASRLAYADFHANWSQHLQLEIETIRQLQPDLIFSNVAYLPLAAAQQLAIPTMAMCSLNWYHIYTAYCGFDHIAQQILDAYNSAACFFCPSPSMPMPGFNNLVTVGPVAVLGQNRQQQLKQQYNWSAADKLVLISLGGIQSRLPVEDWPIHPNIRWLVQGNWQVQHPQAIPLEQLGLNFSDLLASCDLLICKPGYGSYAEASCAGIPILYVDRHDWPEAPALNHWLAQHNRCREVSRQQLQQGEILDAMQSLWHLPALIQVAANGIQQIGQQLLTKLRQSDKKRHSN